jgi:hypothetical protein
MEFRGSIVWQKPFKAVAKGSAGCQPRGKFDGLPASALFAADDFFEFGVAQLLAV